MKSMLSKVMFLSMLFSLVACTTSFEMEPTKKAQSVQGSSDCGVSMKIELGELDKVKFSEDGHTVRITRYEREESTNSYSTNLSINKKIGEVYWDCRCASGSDDGCSWWEDPQNSGRAVVCTGTCNTTSGREGCRNKKIPKTDAPKDLQTETID